MKERAPTLPELTGHQSKFPRVGFRARFGGFISTELVQDGQVASCCRNPVVMAPLLHSSHGSIRFTAKHCSKDISTSFRSETAASASAGASLVSGSSAELTTVFNGSTTSIREHAMVADAGHGTVADHRDAKTSKCLSPLRVESARKTPGRLPSRYEGP